MVLSEDRSSSAIDYDYKGIFLDTAKGVFGFAGLRGTDEKAWEPHYQVFSWSAESGFQRVLDHKLNLDEYAVRGLYAGKTFYIVDDTVTAFDMKSSEWVPID